MVAAREVLYVRITTLWLRDAQLTRGAGMRQSRRGAARRHQQRRLIASPTPVVALSLCKLHRLCEIAANGKRGSSHHQHTLSNAATTTTRRMLPTLEIAALYK